MWGNVRIPEHFKRFKRPFNEEEYKAHMESDKMKAYMQTPEYKENERLVNLHLCTFKTPILEDKKNMRRIIANFTP